MVKALFDTNILIDYLSGVPEARTELERHSSKAISVITWMEVLIGASPDTEPGTRSFLDGFDRIEVDGDIAEASVTLRRTGRMKLPDAIILATAQTTGRLLVTRNTKDFSEDDPGVRVPYHL
jgi:predicted nucleic acid-binding protein